MTPHRRAMFERLWRKRERPKSAATIARELGYPSAAAVHVIAAELGLSARIAVIKQDSGAAPLGGARAILASQARLKPCRRPGVALSQASPARSHLQSAEAGEGA